eukprot:CAMPEP_0119408734 /NCGR_PEP_ID=MMETSP1335-20130426/2208_1 /TAXON_ID=259385 /ORGANISM="Chrysoculter rhomboideus, Strain RCC1486" /LENGTH=66 /DNA_ID=CAMNT_0007433015 /DNA_START=2 /DNA_END=198 /DNA_ORIENTATION=-
MTAASAAVSRGSRLRAHGRWWSHTAAKWGAINQPATNEHRASRDSGPGERERTWEAGAQRACVRPR